MAGVVGSALKWGTIVIGRILTYIWLGGQNVRAEATEPPVAVDVNNFAHTNCSQALAQRPSKRQKSNNPIQVKQFEAIYATEGIALAHRLLSRCDTLHDFCGYRGGMNKITVCDILNTTDYTNINNSALEQLIITTYNSIPLHLASGMSDEIIGNSQKWKHFRECVRNVAVYNLSPKARNELSGDVNFEKVIVSFFELFKESLAPHVGTFFICDDDEIEALTYSVPTNYRFINPDDSQTQLVMPKKDEAAKNEDIKNLFLDENQFAVINLGENSSFRSQRSGNGLYIDEVIILTTEKEYEKFDELRCILPVERAKYIYKIFQQFFVGEIKDNIKDAPFINLIIDSTNVSFSTDIDVTKHSQHKIRVIESVAGVWDAAGKIKKATLFDSQDQLSQEYNTRLQNICEQTAQENENVSSSLTTLKKLTLRMGFNGSTTFSFNDHKMKQLTDEFPRSVEKLASYITSSDADSSTYVTSGLLSVAEHKNKTVYFDIKRSGDALQSKVASELYSASLQKGDAQNTFVFVTHDHLAFMKARLYGVPCIFTRIIKDERHLVLYRPRIFNLEAKKGFVAGLEVQVNNMVTAYKSTRTDCLQKLANFLDLQSAEPTTSSEELTTNIASTLSTLYTTLKAVVDVESIPQNNNIPKKLKSITNYYSSKLDVVLEKLKSITSILVNTHYLDHNVSYDNFSKAIKLAFVYILLLDVYGKASRYWMLIKHESLTNPVVAKTSTDQEVTDQEVTEKIVAYKTFISKYKYVLTIQDDDLNINFDAYDNAIKTIDAIIQKELFKLPPKETSNRDATLYGLFHNLFNTANNTELSDKINSIEKEFQLIGNENGFRQTIQTNNYDATTFKQIKCKIKHVGDTVISTPLQDVPASHTDTAASSSRSSPRLKEKAVNNLKTVISNSFTINILEVISKILSNLAETQLAGLNLLEVADSDLSNKLNNIMKKFNNFITRQKGGTNSVSSGTPAQQGTITSPHSDNKALFECKCSMLARLADYKSYLSELYNICIKQHQYHTKLYENNYDANPYVSRLIRNEAKLNTLVMNADSDIKYLLKKQNNQDEYEKASDAFITKIIDQYTDLPENQGMFPYKEVSSSPAVSGQNSGIVLQSQSDKHAPTKNSSIEDFIHNTTHLKLWKNMNLEMIQVVLDDGKNAAAAAAAAAVGEDAAAVGEDAADADAAAVGEDAADADAAAVGEDAADADADASGSSPASPQLPGTAPRFLSASQPARPPDYKNDPPSILVLSEPQAPGATDVSHRPPSPPYLRGGSRPITKQPIRWTLREYYKKYFPTYNKTYYSSKKD
jgi:hypothetical protein